MICSSYIISLPIGKKGGYEWTWPVVVCYFGIGTGR